jgi:transposase
MAAIGEQAIASCRAQGWVIYKGTCCPCRAFYLRHASVQRIQEKLRPHEAQLTLLDEIPGVDWTLVTARVLGRSLSFNESAGKRKSSHIPKGTVYLKTALVEATNAAARTKCTYFRDKFYRLKARRGYKRAAVAVAHKILVAIYHMLTHQVRYHDLGDL